MRLGDSPVAFGRACEARRGVALGLSPATKSWRCRRGGKVRRRDRPPPRVRPTPLPPSRLHAIAAAAIMATAAISRPGPLKSVRVDALVVLKISKHAAAVHPQQVTGQLLGAPHSCSPTAAC